MDHDKKSFIRRYALCAALLATSCVVLPLLVLGAHASGVGTPSAAAAWWANVLFLWPQYVLWPNGVAERGSEVVHGASVLPFASAAFWLVAIAGYVWPLQRARLRWVLLAFLPAVAVVAQAGLWVLAALDLRLVIDSL